MSVLQVAQVVEDTEAEGPGRRFAVWVQGCTRRCPGCCNPEMWPAEGGDAVDVAELTARILGRRADVEGLTLLGGEPFEQAAAAAALCRAVRAAGLSVVVFTGFEIEELRDLAGEDAAARALLDQCDILVDGPYRADLPEEDRRWLGSSNQRVHLLGSRYSLEDLCLDGANSVEIRLVDGVLTVNGWPGFEVRR